MSISFILVRPRYPGNIGQAARAIKNFGFDELALVAPAASPTHPDAIKLAVGAANLLKRATVYADLKVAIAPLHFLLGTSRRFGRHRRNFVSLPELPSVLPKRGNVGILFGPEEKGLSNEEIACCHRVITIPSNPKFPSLNLAQSVMVVAYELRGLLGWGGGVEIFEAIRRRASKPYDAARRVARRLPASEEAVVPKKSSTPLPQPLATMEQVEGMFQQLESTLAQIGFFPHGNPFMVMRTLRNLFGRSGLTPREIRILRGICRQAMWCHDGKKVEQS